MIGSIELTEAESIMLCEIKFDKGSIKGPDETRRNGEAICELMSLLIARGAIPDSRIHYFTKPTYSIGGRGKSRQDVFENNGTRNEDIFRHPHFLRQFRYFLNGADLSEQVKEQFFQEVSDCGSVTSGDLDPLGKVAKNLTRSFRLEPSIAAEEFFKLALDCGLGVPDASYIRNSVKRVRYAT